MSEEIKPRNLIGKITTKEEEEKLMRAAEEATRRAAELREQAVEDENGYMRVASPVNQPEQKPSIEEKQFLLLFIGNSTEGDEEPELRYWEIVTGRKEAYYAIKNMLLSDYVDIDLIESKIVVEVETIKELKTMYDFMSYVIYKDLIDDEQQYIDLDEYIDESSITANQQEA